MQFNKSVDLTNDPEIIVSFETEAEAKSAVPSLKEEMRNLLAVNGEKPKDMSAHIYLYCPDEVEARAYDVYIYAEAEPDVVLSGASVSEHLRKAEGRLLPVRRANALTRERDRMARRKAKTAKRNLIAGEWADIYYGLPEM